MRALRLMSWKSEPELVEVPDTYWGTRTELVEVLDLGARGLLRPTVTEFALDEAPRAYAALAAGTVEGRAVVVPNAAPTG